MVRQQHDQRSLPQSVVDQGLLKRAQNLIRVNQLRIVARPDIGLVHIEQMDEDESGLAAIGSEPTARRTQDQSSVAPVSHRKRIASHAAEEHRSGA